MKKILFTAVTTLFVHQTFAINMVAKSTPNNYKSIADLVCTGFVVLGVSLITIFGTKSIINTFKQKQSD